VRLWDTLHWDAAASHLKVNHLSASTSPRPPVSHVQVNGPVAAAAYEDGERGGGGAEQVSLCVCVCVCV